MSLTACAQLVEKADPDRFRATMAAPVTARRILFPLYAFNVEVSRAPWVTEEPMIAEMRLQWWRDALEEIKAGGTVRKHEVVDALAAVLDAPGAELLDGLIAARRWDIYKDAFEDAAHFDGYIDATSGHLMWTAARLLGVADENVVRDFAFAVGLSNLLAAIPALEDRGRIPLLDGSVDGVAKLAERGLARHDAAGKQHGQISEDASAALLAGFACKPILQRVVKSPQSVVTGQITPSPFKTSLRLLTVSTFGWWR